MTCLERPTGAAKTISAAALKATCLDLIDRVQASEFSRVDVTKRGRVVAVVVAPPASVVVAERLHGFLRGAVQLPLALDLTAPVLDEAFGAVAGAGRDRPTAWTSSLSRSQPLAGRVKTINADHGGTRLDEVTRAFVSFHQRGFIATRCTIEVTKGAP